jgi:hypothetical protein
LGTIQKGRGFGEEKGPEALAEMFLLILLPVNILKTGEETAYMLGMLIPNCMRSDARRW